MTAHRTAGQLRALRELCALARTGLEICDELARRGEEASDVPRLWLLSLERWCRGEETGPQLAARTRAMERAREREFTADHKIPPPATLAQGPFGDALHWIADARADMAKHPTHTFHTGRVLAHLRDVVTEATGDPREASGARVAAMLVAHRRAIGEECARAKADARLQQAKADKVEAERALGTLPGME